MTLFFAYAVGLHFESINWLAVAASAIAAFMVGGLWYGPLFSKPWVRAQGWSAQRLEELKKQTNPAKFFGGMLVSYFVLATVMAIGVAGYEHPNIHVGAHVGLLTWVAVAAVTMTHQLASGRTIVAYLIDTSCELVYLVVMGAIIGAWH
jgi:hypothetical protein